MVDSKFKTLEELEIKIRVDMHRADPSALEVNSYDADVWNREAVKPEQAFNQVKALFNRHKHVLKMSKKGKPYKVCLLAGHNTEKFDFKFLLSWWKRVSADSFMPADFFTFDTLQMTSMLDAMEFFTQGVFKRKSLKLSDLVDFDDAHDALADVRATVDLANKIYQVFNASNTLQMWKFYRDLPQ